MDSHSLVAYARNVSNEQTRTNVPALPRKEKSRCERGQQKRRKARDRGGAKGGGERAFWGRDLIKRAECFPDHNTKVSHGFFFPFTMQRDYVEFMASATP